MQTSRNKGLSIIIPNHNGANLIRQFFPSILKAIANYQGVYEIIIVDDASTDNSREVIREIADKSNVIKAIFADANGGFSKSCNLGIAAARMEICFFLNTDVALKEDFFAHFQSHFDDDQVFAVTICGIKMDTGEQIDGLKLGKWHRGKLRSTENLMDDEIARLKLTPPFYSFSVQGAYFFASTKKLTGLCGFDEIYSPFIFEETDLAYQALKRGWKIIYEPKCQAWHQVGSSIKSAAGHFRVKTIAARNQLFFTWKNIHSRKLLASHFFFLILRLMTFNMVVWTGLIKALPQIGTVIIKRRAEKKAAIKADCEILREFKEYFQGHQ